MLSEDLGFVQLRQCYQITPTHLSLGKLALIAKHSLENLLQSLLAPLRKGSLESLLAVRLFGWFQDVKNVTVNKRQKQEIVDDTD